MCLIRKETADEKEPSPREGHFNMKWIGVRLRLPNTGAFGGSEEKKGGASGESR